MHPFSVQVGAAMMVSYDVCPVAEITSVCIMLQVEQTPSFNPSLVQVG